MRNLGNRCVKKDNLLEEVLSEVVEVRAILSKGISQQTWARMA